jgi:hypothetical protein
MPSFRSRCLALATSAATLIAFVPAAFAASPNVLFTVTPLPASVSWSLTSPKVQQTYSAIEVVIRNDSTNTLNGARFDVCARVTDDASQPGPTLAQCAARPLEAVLAPLFQSIGIGCTSSAAATAVTCNIGQLRGGGGSASFVLIFKAPASGSSIRYDAIATYGEGPNDSTGASHDDTQSVTRVVALGPPLATEVKSYLPIGGGTLFTGTDGVPKGQLVGNDRYTTIVTVPQTARVEVVEADDPQGCSPDFLVCATSTATIPGSFQFLEIVVRRHPDTLRPGAKIANAVLQYQPGEIVGGSFVPSGDRVDILPCEPGGAIPAGQTRCELLSRRIAYTRKTAPVPALEGVWEFVIKATENGRTYF